VPVEIPTDLAPELVGLAWLIGRWEGTGVGGYPTVDDFRFGQEVEFSYTAGKPFLRYSSRSWILDADGNLVRPAAVETGYWRPRRRGRSRCCSPIPRAMSRSGSVPPTVDRSS